MGLHEGVTQPPPGEVMRLMSAYKFSHVEAEECGKLMLAGIREDHAVQRLNPRFVWIDGRLVDPTRTLEFASPSFRIPEQPRPPIVGDGKVVGYTYTPGGAVSPTPSGPVEYEPASSTPEPVVERSELDDNDDDERDLAHFLMNVRGLTADQAVDAMDRIKAGEPQHEAISEATRPKRTTRRRTPAKRKRT